jgi:hypothetical protein
MRGERIRSLKYSNKMGKADNVISSVHFLRKFIGSLQKRKPAVMVDLHAFLYTMSTNIIKIVKGLYLFF